MNRLVPALALLLCLGAGCSSPQTTPTRSTPPPYTPEIDDEVARLFTHPYPEGEVPSGFRFSPNGKRLTFIRLVGQGDLTSRQLWLRDIESGEDRRLTMSNLNIGSYKWFPDNERLLANAGGHLHVINTSGSGAPRRLTTKSVSGAQLSPNAQQIAFVRSHDLYVMDIENGQERRLTTTGNETTFNGEVDWVYEEELELYQGFWWAPNNQSIAFLQFDESPVTSYPVRYPGAPSPEIVRQRYPQAGEDNPNVKIGVVDLGAEAGSEPRWLELGTPEGEETYIARVGWTPSGDRLFAITLDRLQRVLRLILLDPTGSEAPQTVLEERDELWLNLLDEPHFLEDGNRFIWRSERNGHAHLYLAALNGGEPTQITDGPWQVSELVDVDEENGVIRFVANREGPAVYQLYSVSLSGGDVTRISSESGCHNITFAPDHVHYVDTHSSLRRPPRAELFTAAGQRVATLAEDDLSEFPDIDAVNVEIFDVPGPEGIQYQARMFRPAQLEPDRRYPALVWVYNGPGAQIVRDQWRTKYIPWMRLLARRGVIVFAMDGRGTHGRGRDWEKPIYRRLTEVELSDQLRGVEYLRSLDFIDGERIACFGWSYGGTMVLSSLLRHPGTFRAGVSVAPVSDWRFYDTIYTERFMMRPQENPEGYQASALWPIAGNLEDPLLLIHGLSDDNVHFRNSERMIEALIDEGRRFNVMVYPGQAHGISAPAARRHVFSTITAFILEQLR